MVMVKCIKGQAICMLVTLKKEKLMDQADTFLKTDLIIKVTSKTMKLKPLKDTITLKTWNIEEDLSTTLSMDKVNKKEENINIRVPIIMEKELKVNSYGILFLTTMFMNIFTKVNLMNKENSLEKVFY